MARTSPPPGGGGAVPAGREGGDGACGGSSWPLSSVLDDSVSASEAQWLFSPAELLQTPSIADGMSVAKERELRAKGTNFIMQVGIALKVPQLTLATAAVFLNRFLMRRSLVARRGVKPLHHYEIAATALFLATKVEETCRRMKELVIACCRVAQKNPSLLVDEQTKDFWRWRDTILLHEDVLLEMLCFDLTVDPPHKLLYHMLHRLGASHHRRLRAAAWSFINDSTTTQLCLLFSARTIAAAAIYCAAKHCRFAFPDDHQGRPWWSAQKVQLLNIRRACNYMADVYASPLPHAAPADAPADPAAATASIYAGLRTPETADPRSARTRMVAASDADPEPQLKVPPANQDPVSTSSPFPSSQHEHPLQQQQQQNQQNHYPRPLPHLHPYPHSSVQQLRSSPGRSSQTPPPDHYRLPHHPQPHHPQPHHPQPPPHRSQNYSNPPDYQSHHRDHYSNLSSRHYNRPDHPHVNRYPPPPPPPHQHDRVDDRDRYNVPYDARRKYPQNYDRSGPRHDDHPYRHRPRDDEHGHGGKPRDSTDYRARQSGSHDSRHSEDSNGYSSSSKRPRLDGANGQHPSLPPHPPDPDPDRPGQDGNGSEEGELEE